MSMKKLAAFALATAFALTTALPASALDREDRAPRDKHRVPTATQRATAAAQPQIQTFGQDNGRLRINRSRSQETPGTPPFFEKTSCSFDCGSMHVTCSGSAVYCDESGCAASGGGVILVAVCEAS
jgi:hypothetical protein